LRNELGAPSERGRRGALSIDQDTLGLDPLFVDVDWWRFGEDLALADEAEQAGDAAAVTVHLDRACSRWRGEPFADVEPTAEIVGAVEDVRTTLVDAALRLGERLLLAGRFDEAAAWAERVVGESPYTERAHRLAIAAHLQRRDRHAVAHAASSMQSVLGELGVEPEQPTAMLLRQAAARLGTLDEAATRPSIWAS
jgi:DNA-binding SARP family transcriptional activator